MKKLFYFLTTLLFLASCTTSEIMETVNAVTTESGSAKLTTADVAKGLKEALIKGTNNSSDMASKVDGYFKNPNIKIPFPPDVQRVEDKLRDIGLGNEVDKFVMTLNRGAEEAAKEAAPIFVDAITSMSIEDAWGILRGEDDAATEYLRKTTSAQLTEKFKPVISSALEKTNATKHYTDIINTYNKIPFVEKADPSLENYATQKAIDGLFFLIKNEEAKIRENPAARTTDLLKRVFAEQD